MALLGGFRKALNKGIILKTVRLSVLPSCTLGWTYPSGGMMKGQSDDTLLTPAEVAALFRVDPKTVTRWAKAGKLSSIRTLGGHRRYRAEEVRRFLEGARREE
jgi:excisionase family DNA binding protein